MDGIPYEKLNALFQSASELFSEKKDELCEMDAKMGDGDLGLTMQKGFGALPQLIRENMEAGNIGRTLVRAGLKMSGVVPSTMGTLMSSGLMEGGRAVGVAAELGPEELSRFLTGFAAGVQKRGKCQLGDRTLLDAMDAAAKRADAAFADGKGVREMLEAAVAGARDGVEATKHMIPKYGKAAVFSARAEGVADQGAVAGLYLLEGLARYFT